MGGILGAYNAISDYLHTLNMGSTLFRLILAMFLGCLIGIDRGMKKRVAGVKTHMIVCMGATLVMMTGDFIHVYSNWGRESEILHDLAHRLSAGSVFSEWEPSS